MHRKEIVVSAKTYIITIERTKEVIKNLEEAASNCDRVKMTRFTEELQELHELLDYLFEHLVF